jgi:nitroreductase
VVKRYQLQQNFRRRIMNTTTAESMPTIDKTAAAEPDIHFLLSQRWSPRAFREQPVASDTLTALFQAARWSPSSANRQPWRFVVATKDTPDTYEDLFETINPKNQVWAGRAPVLALGVAKLYFGDRRNTYAQYDLGQAIANLTVEATARGLAVHQMGGFDADKARANLNIPDDYEPMVMLAIGYQDTADILPEPLKQRELASRSRQPLPEIVFSGEWGHPANFVG